MAPERLAGDRRTATEASFPIRVTAPDGLVHAFVYVNDRAVTRCGQPCGEWPCLIGGAPTCGRCLEVLL